MNTAYEIPADAGEADIAAAKAVLFQYPHLLAEDPDLNRMARAACGNVVDLEAGAIKRLERRARLIADTHRKLREVAHANLAVQAQIHAAALSVLDCRSARALDDLLDGPMPGRLGLDRAAVLIEGAAPAGLMAIRRATPGFVDAELGRTRSEQLGRIVRGRADIYGDDAVDLRSQALIRLNIAGHAGLLALGARDPGVFGDNQGTELVNFLARVIERRLAEWVGA